LLSVLKIVFNSVLGYSEDACSAQALNLKVEIAKLSPAGTSFRREHANRVAMLRDSRWTFVQMDCA
jgi:hypothetical protein